MLKLKGMFRVNNYLSGILLLFGFFLILGIAGALFSVALFGQSGGLNAQKWMQAINSIAVFVLPAVAYAYLCTEVPVGDFLKTSKMPRLDVAVFVVLLLILAIPGINLLSYLNQQMVLPQSLAPVEQWMKGMEKSMAELTEKLLTVRTGAGMLLNVLVIAMIPALGEELFFRGALLGILRQKKSLHVAVWVSAIVFSAIHMQFYGFVPRMLLGALFGYILIWSGSLWLTVLAHFANNVMAVLFYYFKTAGYRLPDMDQLGTGNTMWLGVLSLIVTIAGISMLRKILLNTGDK